jgi:hypothetical protein
VPRARRATTAGNDVERVSQMSGKLYAVLYALVMVAIIVTCDVLFFEGRVWERLIANIAIVAVFVGVYFAFLRRRWS